jgi:hypothetical protein
MNRRCQVDVPTAVLCLAVVIDTIGNVRLLISGSQ